VGKGRRLEQSAGGRLSSRGRCSRSLLSSDDAAPFGEGRRELLRPTWQFPVYSSCKLQAFLFHSPIDKSFSALSKHVYRLIFINLGKSMTSIMPGKNFALQEGLEQALRFSLAQPVKFFFFSGITL